MNRREFAAAVLAIPQTPAAPVPDPYKLQIEYDLIVPFTYKANPLNQASLPRMVPKFIAFTAHRADTVLTLTQHLLPVGYSATYGNGFVTLLGFTNLGHIPGWNYFLNSVIVQKPANAAAAKIGDRIEWRLGKRYSGT